MVGGRKKGVFVGGNELAGWLLQIAAGLHQLNHIEMVIISHHNCPNLQRERERERERECVCV